MRTADSDPRGNARRRRARPRHCSRRRGSGLGAVATTPDALAHTVEAEGLQIVHPWTEPAAKGSATTAYPTLVSQSERAMTLAGVASPVAERVEIVVDGSAVERLQLPAGETLGQGQFHLHLVGLTRDLEIMMVVGESTMMPQTAKGDGAMMEGEMEMGKRE